MCGPVRKAIQRDHKKQKTCLGRPTFCGDFATTRGAEGRTRSDGAATAARGSAAHRSAASHERQQRAGAAGRARRRAGAAAATAGRAHLRRRVVEARPEGGRGLLGGGRGHAGYRARSPGPGSRVIAGRLSSTNAGERVSRALQRRREDLATPEGFLSFVAPPALHRQCEGEQRRGPAAGSGLLGRRRAVPRARRRPTRGQAQDRHTDGETHHLALQDEPFSGDGNPPAPADGEPEHFRRPAAAARGTTGSETTRTVPENPARGARPRAAPGRPPSLRAVVELLTPSHAPSGLTYKTCPCWWTLFAQLKA